MGRGVPGCAKVGESSEGAEAYEIEKNLSKLPLACNYYRPWQMGFGALKPHPLVSEYKDGEKTISPTAIEDAYALVGEPLEYRLPISFKLYNSRAQFQKCQWWNQDSGLDFIQDQIGMIYLPGDPDIYDETGKIEFCTCEAGASDIYSTRALETAPEDGYIGGFIMWNVWSLAGGAVCNGAKPECPCYSGKWSYLTEEKTLAGMPVTANQILELRFWANEWETQEQYDNFFTKKPNHDDPRTPAIYTFTRWIHPTSDSEDSIMMGKKLSLCQPVPPHNREFIPSVYVSNLCSEEISALI